MEIVYIKSINRKGKPERIWKIYDPKHYSIIVADIKIVIALGAKEVSFQIGDNPPLPCTKENLEKYFTLPSEPVAVVETSPNPISYPLIILCFKNDPRNREYTYVYCNKAGGVNPKKSCKIITGGTSYDEVIIKKITYVDYLPRSVTKVFNLMSEDTALVSRL